MLTDLQALMADVLTAPPPLEANPAWLHNLFFINAQYVIPRLGLFLAGMMVAGVAVTIAQTGILIAHKRLKVDFERVNPLSGVKRLVSLQGIVELLKALLKFTVVGWVAYSFLRSRANDLIAFSQMDIRTSLGHWSELAGALTIRTGAVYLLLALVDYGYQRWQYLRSLRMTKEEVKEEYKQQEGDPVIRSRIRGQMRRIARQRMMANVRLADVIITNPTHLAVAIQYKTEEMSAPKVMAKGAYLMAERIIELARKHNIPIVQNIPLARALFRSVEVDQEIPPDLYMAMAEVLAYVYRLRGKGAMN
jgi:flagellar biosynthetic protein FlhB